MIERLHGIVIYRIVLQTAFRRYLFTFLLAPEKTNAWAIKTGIIMIFIRRNLSVIRCYTWILSMA